MKAVDPSTTGNKRTFRRKKSLISFDSTQIFHHSRAQLLGLFLIIFIAQAIFFLVMHRYYLEWDRNGITRNGWYLIAEHVAAGNGFSSEWLLTYAAFERKDKSLVLTAARGPLPILYLAALILLFSEPYHYPVPYYPILIATWLLSAGTALLSYAIATHMTRSKVIGTVTMLLTGFHLSGMYINTTFSYCSEPIFTFLFALAFYLGCIAAERGLMRHAVASGICLGLACLSRQIIILLPALYFLVFGITQRRNVWRLAIAACLSFALVQAPWVVRNKLVFDEPVFTSTLGGYGLFLAAYAAEHSTKKIGYDWPDAEMARKQMVQVVTEAGNTLETINEHQLDTILRRKARDMIHRHRWQYLRNALMNCVYILYRHNSGTGLYAVQNLLYYVLAAIGGVITWRRGIRGMISIALVIAYFVVIYTPYVTQYRYLFPVTPFLFIFTAVAVVWGGSQLTGRYRKA